MWLIRASLLLLLLPACFDGSLSTGAPLSCRDGTDCPTDRFCLLTETPRCVSSDLPCIAIERRAAAPLTDGTPCGDERICVSAACVEPRCGDGVVSGTETCDGGDGCRADCSRCGDGVIDDGETCDNGAQNSDVQPGACRTSCVLSRCGDGVRDPGEGCDDGAANDDDAADACRTSCSRPGCGDGIADDGERCDQGAANDDDLPDACRTTCVPASCGDGVIDDGEACDNGAQNSDVQPGACRTSCLLSACGDGVRDPGEGCDEGAQNSDVQSGACRTTCARPGCGDGVIDPGEACDDGPLNSATGANACRPTCVAARCGDGVIDDGEACDDGARNSDVQPGACRTSCEAAVCGDGVRDPGEGCDDGVANSDANADACRTRCDQPRCGDGVRDSGEVCDDGNVDSADGCRGDCLKLEVCGDGVVDAGEACDDANVNPRDGCDGCLRQGWSRELLVSGTVEGRDARSVAITARAAAVDAIGRIIVPSGNRLLRIELDGTASLVAGTGETGFSGDGGPATGARFSAFISGLVVDPFGRVVIADSENCRVRRIEGDGTIRTIAGSGSCGFSGDGGPATAAGLGQLGGVVLDGQGRLLVVSANRVRRIDGSGIITTIAGTGAFGNFTGAGDGGPAVDAAFSFPRGLAVDSAGRVLVADTNAHRIRRIDNDGTIRTIAGISGSGFSGDGGPATSATLTLPGGVAVDGQDRVLIADSGNHRVRRIEREGTIRTIVGTGTFGFGGDGGQAAAATLGAPRDLIVDGRGRLIIAEEGNLRVRRVDESGVITTVAGSGKIDFSGDGGPATSIPLLPCLFLAADAGGGVWVSENDICVAGALRSRIRRVGSDGFTDVITDSSFEGFDGDGGPAIDALLASPEGIAIDGDGNLIIADRNNGRLRRVTTGGIIETIAGAGPAGVPDEGVLATEANLFAPSHVAVDGLGRILYREIGRIRRIELDGRVFTIAGNGSSGVGSSGDGGNAVDAEINFGGFAVDGTEVVLVDAISNSVRRVGADGRIDTIAGTGQSGFSGDDGPATAARLANPADVAVDRLGRVVIADLGNQRVRRIEPDGTIVTIAGGGGGAGDGGPATAALLGAPVDVEVDADGRVLIADGNTSSVRRIEFDGTISTVVGGVHPAGPGRFVRSRLYPTTALVGLSSTRLVSVGALGRGLHIDLTRERVEVAIGHPDAAPVAHGLARFAPLLRDAGGAAVDPVTRSLVITERASGDLRVIDLDDDADSVIDDQATWRHRIVPTGLRGPAGLAFDARTGTFIVADEADHTVKRLTREGEVVEVLFGRSGAAGNFPGFLNGPTHAAVSPTSGAIYVADTGNHRVLRLSDGDGVGLVIGDGSVSSAGEGTPARLFPVHGPRQLAVDGFGNLYVASTTTIRLVANIDGDEDADGDDRVFTIFGGGARDAFPESDTFCLGALTHDEGTIYVVDSCQGFMVRVTAQTGGGG